MEKCLSENNLEFTSPWTLVLVGSKGNGKSATGNSILGTKMFRSERSSSGVTTTFELQKQKLEDGQMLNVIDTPGLIDSFSDNEFIAKEIIDCMNKAGDGIHAFLVVFSVRNRFSKEEEAAINSLVMLFGEKVYDYMIAVFTGGDLLDKDGETLDDFLHECPETLKETLSLCENRYVLFDNKTRDETRRSNQIKKFASFVNCVSLKNGGKPYTSEMFTKFKEEAEKLQALKDTKWRETKQEISVLTEQMGEDQFKRITKMVEPKLKETTVNLELQLAGERAARVKAEEEAKFAKKKSDLVKHLMKEQITLMKCGEKEKVRTFFELGSCVIL